MLDDVPPHKHGLVISMQSVAGPLFTISVGKRVHYVVLSQGQNLDSLVLTAENQAIRLCG